MPVVKRCKRASCKAYPRCDHPWWLSVMHVGRRYRMPVNDFAFARGADHLVTTRQEAERVWEPLFVSEIMSGHDPQTGPPSRPAAPESSIGDYISKYLVEHVALTPTGRQRTKGSSCRALARVISDLPLADLETARPAEAIRKAYKHRSVATVNRYLAELRYITNWALSRRDITRSPFHKFGVRISTRDEVQRDRRVSEEEEARLLQACERLDRRKEGASRLTWEDVTRIRERAAQGVTQKELAAEFRLASGMVSLIVNNHIWREGISPVRPYGKEMRDRIIGAIETCCRKGELLKIQNKHVDRVHGWIKIPREHTKSRKERIIPFRGNKRLTEILERRRALGDDAYVFGTWASGAFVKDFRRAWESVLLIANGVKPNYRGRRMKLSHACVEKLAEIDLHFHDLRHEGLSRYGEGGMLLRELQALAGHASPVTTVRYEHVDHARLADAMRRAGKTRAARRGPVA
jgi:integrase